jgi:hypothetical protein
MGTEKAPRANVTVEAFFDEPIEGVDYRYALGLQ